MSLKRQSAPVKLFVFSQMHERNQGQEEIQGPTKYHQASFLGPFKESRIGLTTKHSDTINKTIKKCPFCPYKSPVSTNIQTHIKFNHTREKPFSCLQCCFRFTLKTDLKKHLLVHTGEKPYSCPKCGLKFRQMQHLRRHLSKKSRCDTNI